MQLVVSVLLASLLPRPAGAHGWSFEGNYVALGPSLGTVRFERDRAMHLGAELSAGHVGTRISYGGWLDYQHANTPLNQERLGVGLQVMSPMLAMIGLDAGVLTVRAQSEWHVGFRARVFLSAGYVSVAGGGGVVDELGTFTEFSLLLKLPFSCQLDFTVPIFCPSFWKERALDRSLRQRRATGNAAQCQ